MTLRITVTPDQGKVGLRIYRDIAGYDVAIYAYRGFRRTPAIRPDNPAAPTQLTLFYPELSAYGFSVSGRAGDGVMSFEAGYYDSREGRSGTGFTVPNSQLRFLIGYQFQPVEDLTLACQFYTENLRDYSEYRATPPAGFPIDKRWSDTFTLRLKQFYLHQTLRLSVFASANTSNDYLYLNPLLRYGFSDKVSGAVGANVFGGKPAGLFGQFAHDDNVTFRFDASFINHTV